MKGTLILVPTPIAPDSPEASFTAFDPDILLPIRYFIVEEIRSARRFLRKLHPDFPIDACQFTMLNEHTHTSDYPEMLHSLEEGHDTVLMSEAGLPCVADPGWQIVVLAHQSNIIVKPLPGPSSIMQALMASGFIGQQFVFHGYLPVAPAQRAKALQMIERDTVQRHFTQIFIETPYRNQQMLNTLIKTLHPDTRLCVASGLMSDTEYIRSQTIAEWSMSKASLSKNPAVFLIYR